MYRISGVPSQLSVEQMCREIDRIVSSFNAILTEHKKKIQELEEQIEYLKSRVD